MKREFKKPIIDEGEVDEFNRTFEREYYGADEEGAQDDAFDPFKGNEEKVRAFEETLRLRHASLRERISPMQSQLTKDMNRWEEQQLLVSGVMKRTSAIEEDESNDVRVHLLVSHAQPAFLAGHTQLSKVTEPVMPVKDPTSDMALMARKGSAILREMMARKDRQAMRKKFWEIQGSQMGAAMGLPAQQEDDDGDSAVMTNRYTQSFISF